MNRCIYNLELLILGTARTPWQDYDEPINPESPACYIRQLKDTDVDTVTICPTAWKRPLWNSKIDPHWKEEAPHIPKPYFTADLKYQEKAYFRLRDYMMAGNDPVGVAIKAAYEIGIEPFISYRMNDHHYLADKEAFIHPAFWKNNPHLWMSEKQRYFNYINQEVRDYYFSLLEELVSLYDVAGLELDFMRSPKFFLPDQIQEGTTIMTDFVRRVRAMLDEYGHKRGKHLKLCVRVPHTVEECKRVGLDVGTWDSERFIDVVNVSTYFISSPYIEVEGFKEWIKNTPLIGETHFIVETAKIYNGFSNNVSRKTTAQMYRALAASFLDRGMDGISFFNVDYTRHHFFGEPRRLGLKDGQPPLYALKGITDIEELARLDKHYFINTKFGPLPQTNNLDVDMYIADKSPSADFKYALLRLKTEEPSQKLRYRVRVNGEEVEESTWLGELFVPISTEGVFGCEYCKYYIVPTSLLKHGYNKIEAVNLSNEPTCWDNKAVYNMVELALYKENSFLETKNQ